MTTRPSQAPTLKTGVRALLLVGVIGGLAQSVTGASGSLLARPVSGSDAYAGLPQAGLVAGSAAAALVLARVTVRRGRRTALAAGAAAAVLGCALVVAGATTNSLRLVLLGSVLAGAGNSAVMLLRYAAADLVHEGGRARAIAAVLLATAAGAVVGPSLLGPADAVGRVLGLPTLTGPYLLATAAFVLMGVLSIATPRGPRLAPFTAVLQRPPGPRVTWSVDGIRGLVVLGVANLVMVAVMTMAPVHLHHLGHSLTIIGAVVSLHLAAMFAPSPLSGWATERFGARRAAALSAVLLVVATTVAAAGSGSLPILGTGLLLLGLGWNLALVSGSVLLTSHVDPAGRPRRESWGEVSMGAAAATGSVAAGPLVQSSGYATLAVVGALVAATLLPALAEKAPALGAHRGAQARRRPSNP